MKKIITLLIAAFAFAGLQAQTTEDARRVILGKKKENSSQKDPGDIFGSREERRVNEENGTRYPSGSREAQIERINREYDYKIQTIRNNNSLSSAEKERIIRDLNNQRTKKIKQINNDYKRNDRNDDDDDDDRYEKRNKGKHKGWKKGNGHKKNKHKGHDDDDD